MQKRSFWPITTFHKKGTRPQNIPSLNVNCNSLQWTIYIYMPYSQAHKFGILLEKLRHKAMAFLSPLQVRGVGRRAGEGRGLHEKLSFSGTKACQKPRSSPPWHQSMPKPIPGTTVPWHRNIAKKHHNLAKNNLLPKAGPNTATKYAKNKTTEQGSPLKAPKHAKNLGAHLLGHRSMPKASIEKLLLGPYIHTYYPFFF